MGARPEVLVEDDEISLMDIYDFIRDGFKTLVGMSVLGLAVGVGVSFVLPEKFNASGSIESTQVAAKPVEDLQGLAEKMRSPTYYSTQTLQACGLADKINAGDQLAKDLGPTVGRQSSFVSVSFEASTPAQASQCLQAVLDDVRLNQSTLARASKLRVQDQIRLASQQLERAVELRDQQLALDVQRLGVAKQKLESAERFIAEFENRIMSFDFGNDQFSASSLLLATLQSKQNEVKDLQIQIDGLGMKVRAKITTVDDSVFEFEELVAQLRESLNAPATRDAQFATPIHAPDTKVSPKRGLISVMALLIGGFLGLMILIGRRAYRHIRQHDADRLGA